MLHIQVIGKKYLNTGHPSTGNWQRSIWGHECPMSGYPLPVTHGGTAHKYCIFTSRGVRLALVKSSGLGISGVNGVW